MPTGPVEVPAALATIARGSSLGAGWEEELLDAYGVGLDVDRIRYFRLLCDLSD